MHFSKRKKKPIKLKTLHGIEENAAIVNDRFN